MSTFACAYAADPNLSFEPLVEPRCGIAFGPLGIDIDAHRVHVDGQEIAFTWLEFKLLVALARQPDRVRSRHQLLAEVWRVSPTNLTRTVDTHVKRLRDKLGTAGRMIQTVRGVGYRLSDLPSVQDFGGRCNARKAFGNCPADDEGRRVGALPVASGRVVKLLSESAGRPLLGAHG